MQSRGRFLHAESAKEAQLDYARLTLADQGQTVQGIVERFEIEMLARRDFHEDFIEAAGSVTAAALQGIAGARVIDQNLADGMSGGGNEFLLRGEGPAVFRQAKIKLVYQRGGAQGVVRALPGKRLAGNGADFVVEEGNELGSRECLFRLWCAPRHWEQVSKKTRGGMTPFARSGRYIKRRTNIMKTLRYAAQAGTKFANQWRLEYLRYLEYSPMTGSQKRNPIARIAVLALCCAPGFASTLSWYTGNTENATTVGLSNGVFTFNSSQVQANVYDAFIVPADGWEVTSVFSNDELLPTTVVTQANWQIRSGVSSGNGGTLDSAGTSAATQTQVFSGSGYVIDTIEVNNLSVYLAPGEYWLSVAPVTTGTSDNPAIVPTTDANAVGLPAETGMGALTFDNFPLLPNDPLNYFPNPTAGGEPHDWSMGLYTSALVAAPEPSTLSFMAAALLLPCIWRLRRFRRVKQ